MSNMGNLVAATQAAYESWKATNPSSIGQWDELSDAQVSALFREDQKYQQAIRDAQAIETSFYEARTAAFAELEASHVAARVALATAWQTKEDAGFDVDA